MNSYNLYKHKQIEERAVEVANYIIENNATVRETAKKFGISKSTVHKDVTERLGRIDPLRGDGHTGEISASCTT